MRLERNFVVNPTTGIMAILLVITISGSLEFGLDLNWIAISFGGLLFFYIGTRIIKIFNDKKIMLLFGEFLTLILLLVSFRSVAGILAIPIAVLWLIVLSTGGIIIGSKKAPIPYYSIALYCIGSIFVIHSFLQYRSWDIIRSLPLTPPEGAFGMFLIFITFPSILQWLLSYQYSSVTFIVITTLLMLLHGFRADAALILLSAFLVIWKKHSYISYTFLIALILLFMLVGITRNNLNVPILERPIFRLSTTYYYSKEVLKWFLSPLPSLDPFWLFSIPLHPSQSIGRGIYGKEYGITPTIFVELVVSSGLLGMFLISLVLGILSGYSFRLFLENRDIFSYAIIWPILITRVEIGMSQLDLVMISGSVTFAILANIFNERLSATSVK